MHLHERKGLLGIRGDKPTNEEGDAHDCGTNAGGACVVHRLKVLAEGKLLILRLQGVSSPLVARGREDAGGPDHKGKNEGLLCKGLWLEDRCHGNTNEATRPAVDDVAHHGRNVSLIQKSWLDLPAHTLTKAVVGDRQHDGAEQESADESAHAAAESSEGHCHVDDLKDWKLQHVGREGGEEEVRDQLEVHLLHCLSNCHALHQESVHQWLADGRQNGCHKGCRGTLSSSSEDLAKEVGTGSHRICLHHRLVTCWQSTQGPSPLS
mmetsp:Transcript_128566/g.181391  ORF Transcript_128566/g.181391 Transcript_128566/m.181391 type:complete len:265 (-) Transcript_128566:205-999(-)